MTFDLLIKNGTIVDGTGRPQFKGDIAVTGDRIVQIGQIEGGAKRVIDAAGLIVAPGFVDPHTHYDAQICWDPLVNCSSEHGITTVVMGNCGVGIAPVRPEAREIVMGDLVNLEAIPLEVLQAGITWDWESFPDFMKAAEKRGSALNLAFLAPLTPFRHYVMGEDAMDRAATSEETAAIRKLLLDAMRAGAVGFSTTNAKSHIGFQGRPLACVRASNDELASYASVLKEVGRGAISIALGSAAVGLNDDDYALVDRLLTESNAPLTFLALIKHLDNPTAHIETMKRIEPLTARGAKPQMHSTNLVSDLNLRDPYMMTAFPSWHGLFDRPLETQKGIYRDPAFRQKFREELKTSRAFHGDFALVWVTDATRDDFKSLVGKNVAAIAAERGVDPLDMFFDLALEDNLELQYTTIRFGVPEEYLSDERTLIGLSDGGAHIGILCNAGYTTEMLGDLVRDRQLMTLEIAIKRITSEPADFYGLSDRGRIAVGMAADFAIFNPKTVNSNSARPEAHYDLPGGGRRLAVAATGIEYTIVNGEVLYAAGKPTGAKAGRILRPGT